MKICLFLNCLYLLTKQAIFHATYYYKCNKLFKMFVIVCLIVLRKADSSMLHNMCGFCACNPWRQKLILADTCLSLDPATISLLDRLFWLLRSDDLSLATSVCKYKAVETVRLLFSKYCCLKHPSHRIFLHNSFACWVVAPSQGLVTFPQADEITPCFGALCH